MDKHICVKHKNMCGHKRQHVQGGGYLQQDREWDERRYTEVFNISVISYLLKKRSEANMTKPKGESIGVYYIINYAFVNIQNILE